MLVWFAQVGGEGSGSDHGGLHSGLDTQGSSNIIRINSTNLAATDELMIACMCSSILEARAGNLIAFVQ